MLAGELAHILRKVRLHNPPTIRSAVSVLEEAIADFSGSGACLFEYSHGGVNYLSRWIDGLRMEDIAGSLGMSEKADVKWIVIDPAGDPRCESEEEATLRVVKFPLFEGTESFGNFYITGRERFRIDEDSIGLLAEVVSSILARFLDSADKSEISLDRQNLKMELLGAVRDETKMKGVLLRMMEFSQSEFCCYYSEAGDCCLHVMLDGRELSHRVQEIHERLKAAYRMFSNDPDADGICREKVYYRNAGRNMTYLVGNSRIESYFLVPVIFDSTVRGVLFLGSVREDAFARDTIRFFDGLAEEDDVRNPLLYMLSGETAVLRETVSRLPSACALVSRDGKIIFGNQAMSSTLRLEGPLPEDIDEIRKLSPFNLGGIWNEFRTLGRTLTGRLLASSGDTAMTLSVDWVSLEKVSREIGSVVLIRDVSEVAAKENAMEELLATVAHELRTPMTALKNSLSIMLDESGSGRGAVSDGGDPAAGGRAGFIHTALRTLDRLNVLVNGLVDASSLRVKDRKAIPSEVDTRGFLEDAVILFRNSIYKKKIDLDIKVDGEVPGIFIDRDMMEQVVQNLVSNSLRHVPGGGRITIEARPCTAVPGNPSLNSINGMVEGLRFVNLRITDSGPGLPDEIVAMINESENRGRGTLHGLGLYIADRLVHMHGGRMTAERADGKGGQVDLYLAADRTAGEAMITLAGAERALDEVVSRGYSPALYVLEKKDDRCWLNLVSIWPERPVVEPDPGQVGGGGFYFWPVTEGCAIVLSVEQARRDKPPFFEQVTGGTLQIVGDGGWSPLRIGRACSPGDGSTFSNLLKNAIEDLTVEKVMI